MSLFQSQKSPLPEILHQIAVLKNVQENRTIYLFVPKLHKEKSRFLNSLHVFMVKDFSLSLATWLYGTARCLKTSWGTKDKSLALLHDHPFTKGGKNKTRACLTRVLQTFISVEEKLFILIPTTSVFLPISSVTNSQCGRVQIFLSFRFYVNSILEDVKVQNVPFLQF